MKKPVILITGANGQLGKEFRDLSVLFPQFEFLFAGKDELPIDNLQAIEPYFNQYTPSFCINCAAYTAVDKAESDKDTALLVNANAVGMIARACSKHHCKLIHISTDYVFNGQSPVAYKETDSTNPVNAYGASKLKGEELCLQENPEAIIIRTAWVYSAHGNNFVKTMLRLMKEKESINVVSDQTGAPTYAADLAMTIMKMVESGTWKEGIYHYSNQGKISWYDFAVAIKELSGSDCVVNPIPSAQYATPARRPSYSLLNTQKIQSAYGIIIPAWKDSLIKCLHQLKVIS